jgi:hypothetical protein
MIAPISTTPARIPKAIQPHWVLLLVLSLFFEATAAPAAAAPAGLTPLVVVVVEDEVLWLGCAAAVVV